MKKYVFSLIFSVCVGCGLVMGQTASSLFQPFGWEQASMVAARENKLVLVEVGNVGKEVRERIQKDSEIVNYLLRNAVAIRIDMDSPQGRAFEPRLMLYAYPAFAFFMPYGDLVGIATPGEVRNRPERLLEVLDESKELARIKKRNSRSVKFMDLTWEESKALAAKGGKNIFVNVSDASVQSSLLMDKNVFTLNQVADFYNAHFVNLRVNLSDASELAAKYKIKEAPAFLYFNAEGKLLLHAEGVCTSEDIIGHGGAALKKSQGISFQNISDTEAVRLASAEGKFIFIDNYVEGRVHQELVKNVFTDPEVTDFFDEHFINISKVGSNACLLFSDGNGRELHRVLSVEDSQDLLNEARKVLTGRGLAGLVAKYRQGERSEAFMEEYIVTLYGAGKVQEASQIVMDYLLPLRPECLLQKRYWELFHKYGADADPSFFDYILSHQAQLSNLYGEEVVRAKITSLWIAGAEHFIKDNRFDEEGFKVYVKRLKKEKVADWQIIARNARMNAAEKLGDWKTFINLAEEKWYEEKIGDVELYRWATKINEQCADGNVRYKMAQWLSQRVSDINKKEYLTGKVDLTSYRGFFEKLSDDLLRN